MYRREDVERGLELMSRLGEVMPDDARENVAAVYADVRNRLRVPFVNFLFRALANYPAYLEFAWGRIAPYLLSADFERAADELRGRALVEPIPEG
ncbi:MAG: halocarboxylic acid dehydrogenase DehI family protein, partial [Actinomycetota bacterium]|nr:halocarboxylic acid dehydrogenase DehI family protein [Actinomycetota bacterium]